MKQLLCLLALAALALAQQRAELKPIVIACQGANAGSGRFEITGVLPGQYILHPLPPGLGGAAFLVKSPLDIRDQPIDNIEVAAINPFTLTGSVILPENPPAKLGNTRVVLTSEDEIMASVHTARPAPDGFFKLDSMLPGRYRFFVTPLPCQLHIASVRIAGKEFIHGMIEIPSGAPQLELTLGASEASISGPMSGADGNPAPGDYLLIPFENLDPDNTEDEEYLEPHLSRARRVKVEPNSRQSICVKLPSAAR